MRELFLSQFLDGHMTCHYSFELSIYCSQSGGLQFLQELNDTVGGKLSEFIVQINNCYPPEVVEYYSPNYSKTLMQKIDEYSPAV